ncbi:MAG: T9SS type A sorting domain-containing protein [Flavobacteriales bacterium]
MLQRMALHLLLWMAVLPVVAQRPVALRTAHALAGGGGTFRLAGQQVVVHQCIGQGSVIGSGAQGGVVVHQGFLQPASAAVRVADDAPLEAVAFPNPYRGSFDLRFGEMPEAPVRTELIDASGRTVWSWLHPPMQQLNLSPAIAAAGAYLLRVTSGSRTTTLHLIQLP